MVHYAGALDRDPFAPDRSDRSEISELTDSFTRVNLRETTALLTAMEYFLEGTPEGASIRRELRQRTHRLPAWLTSLTPLRVTRVMTTTHPFHDGEDVLVEVLTESCHSFTVAVYIDHNLGTLIKDAFVIPTDVDAVRAILLNKTDDPEIAMTPLDPAEARARIEAAARRPTAPSPLRIRYVAAVPASRGVSGPTTAGWRRGIPVHRVE